MKVIKHFNKLISRVLLSLLIISIALIPQSQITASADYNNNITEPYTPTLFASSEELSRYEPMLDGVFTYEELVKEVQENTTYPKLDDTKAWDLLITQKGISHIDDELLDEFIQAKPKDLTELYTQLDELYLKNPTQTEITQIQIPDQIKECERAIGSIKDKFACAIKEVELRKAGTKREYVHSTYYMDFTPATHSHITGTVTFTNASATVAGDGSNFDPEITVGDYIRQSDGTQWYKVSARASDTSLTITPAFQQATHTDDANASFVCVSATNNGTTTSLAFPHLNRYTTDTVRTAGDILKVRANQTNTIVGIDITFDEAGTVAAYNEIRGCSIADDPFSDASDTQPVFDLVASAKFFKNYQNFWKINNLGFINGAGAIQFSTSATILFDTCTFSVAPSYGIYSSGTGQLITVNNCTFFSNHTANIEVVGSAWLTVTGSTFNGGAHATTCGIRSTTACTVTIINSTFGQTTTHSTADISLTNCISLTMRNVVLASGTPLVLGGIDSKVTSEDNGQVLGASKAWYYSGTITKCAAGLTDTTVRAGGGTSSVLMLPSSVVTIKYPLNIAYGSLNPDFAINCPASETTVTIYIRSYTAWGTYPTAAQLFIQADYLDVDDGTGHRAQSTASTQVISDGSTWVAFTTTFTPAVAGLAYIKVNFGLYTATEGIYVDVKPVVS